MSDNPKGPIAHLTVDGGKEAIEFYKKALSAKEISCTLFNDGKRVMHAQLEINGGTIYLHDDFPEMSGGKKSTVEALGGSPITMHMNVANADESYNQAMAAGAKSAMKPEDMFWGARYAQIKDPFGHIWAFMHPLPAK